MECWAFLIFGEFTFLFTFSRFGSPVPVPCPVPLVLVANRPVSGSVRKLPEAVKFLWHRKSTAGDKRFLFFTESLFYVPTS